jgi:hypothetical protein
MEEDEDLDEAELKNRNGKSNPTLANRFNSRGAVTTKNK